MTGLLFRVPRSGPGNVPSPGAWGGIAHARAPSQPQYPVLLRSTPQPGFLPSSPSPAQARLLALSQQSQRPQSRSPSSLQPRLPTLSPLHPIRPLHSGPHHPPVRTPCFGSHLPSTTRLLTRVPGIPSRGPARPLGAEGPSLPHIPRRCRHQCSTRSRPLGLGASAASLSWFWLQALRLSFPIPSTLLVSYGHPDRVAFVAPPVSWAEGHCTAMISAVWTMLFLGTGTHLL